MSYWWQSLSPITRLRMKGKTIVRFTQEGCQGRNEFQWAGKIEGFQWSEKRQCNEIVIRIIIHNKSYGDVRDNMDPEIFTYPLVNGDIQNVAGVWALFA